MKVLRRMAGGILLMALFTSCFNSSEVKIGVIIPVKGSLADYGYQIRSGIQMAHEEIQTLSQQGKDIKKNYELIMKDEDDDPEKVIETFHELRKQGVTAIIGAASSTNTLALGALANEHDIVLLSPASSSPEINQDSGDYVFRNYPSDTLEAQQLANLIFQKCRIQKVLMVRSQNDFGEGITFEMLRFARQNSKEIPDRVVKFDPDPNLTDFVSVVDEIVEINPEAVFMAAYMDGLIPLIREIRTREELANVYLFTCSAFLGDEVVKVLGKEAVEGIIFTSYHWNPNENKPIIQDFVHKFEDHFKITPTIYAATGYDAMWILARAIESVNHNIADEVRSAMNNESFEGVLGETDFNKRGDVTRIPIIYRMIEGQKTVLTPEEIDVIKTDVLTRI